MVNLARVRLGLLSIAGLALLAMASNAQATIDISGNTSYQISGSTVTMNVDQITNNTANYTTGTLYLELRATTQSSPVGAGYTLALVSLASTSGGAASSGTLPSGAYFYGITAYGTYTAPACGTYYIHITVLEYPNLSTIQDSVTFPNTQSLGCSGGAPSPPPPPPPGGGGTVDLSGSITYAVNGSTVTLTAANIVNNTSSTTGTLHLKLIATTGSSPYGTGYALADANLSYINGTGTLTPGQSFVNVSTSPSYSAPPCGTYYPHMIVTQYPDLNTVLDVATFSPVSLGCDGGGGGGGGGGSIGWFSIGGLVAALLVRRRLRRPLLA
jgi:hypothetical protein